MGATTEATPTPMPPRNRKIWKSARLVTKALPSAPTKYRIPIAKSTFLRPYLSTGLPAISAPKMVPSSAVATVKPSPPGLSS